MRSQIFVGSSKEGLKYISAISQYLEPVGDVAPWTGAFTQNRSALDSLMRKIRLSDFAILIATCDDAVLKRDEISVVPRDNIIFEFGLFMGAGGLDRAFLLAEEGAELPSDLDGITVARFSMEKDAYNPLEKVCAQIAEHIRMEQQTSTLGLLPSTALAIGYYHSFVKGVCEQIRDTKVLNAAGKEVKVKNFHLHIIIPNELDHDGIVEFAREYSERNGLEQAQTISHSPKQRGYPFQFKIDPDNQDPNEAMEVMLYDIPSTLNTIPESVKLFLPTEKVGPSSEYEFLESRELQNFGKVLQHLVSKNALTRKHVSVIERMTL